MKLDDKKPVCNVVCFSSKEEFFSLKSDWNNLVKKSINPHPFLLWEWMYSWWEVYNTKHMKLYILAIYNDAKLISVAPFYIKNYTSLVSRLSMLGEGERVRDKVVTHYPDIIVDSKYRSDAVSVLSAFLQKNLFSKKGFSYASFDLVKKKSVILEIEQILAKDFTVKNTHLGYHFMIQLPDSEDEYMAKLSKSTRKQFRLKLNRTHKEKVTQIKTEQDLEKGFKLIEELHRARWESKANNCIFDSKQFSSFHNKLCQQFKQQNVLSFRVFYHNEEAVAAVYNFNYNNVSYSYLGGFKSTEEKRLSPMFIFDILEVKSLIQQKYSYYDLLSAEDMDCYKIQYASEAKPLYTLLWLQKGIIARCIRAYLCMRPFLAKIYQKAQEYRVKG